MRNVLFPSPDLQLQLRFSRDLLSLSMSSAVQKRALLCVDAFASQFTNILCSNRGLKRDCLVDEPLSSKIPSIFDHKALGSSIIKSNYQLAKQLDPVGQGIAHTSILENEEAYAYYKKFRTARPPKQHQPTPRNGATAPVIKADRDQTRVRQRYMKWNRTELVNQLLSVEQQYAELHERYLATNDTLLEWRLRTEVAETQLKHEREQQTREARPPLPAKPSSPNPRHRRSAERTTGPLPKHLVSLLAFANHHNVSEQKVLTHVTMDMPLLPAKRGEWTDTDGTMVTLALDAKGRTAFHQLYHELPPFVACKQCPHQETEPSVDQTKQR